MPTANAIRPLTWKKYAADYYWAEWPGSDGEVFFVSRLKGDRWEFDCRGDIEPTSIRIFSGSLCDGQRECQKLVDDEFIASEFSDVLN